MITLKIAITVLLFEIACKHSYSDIALDIAVDYDVQSGMLKCK